MSFGVWPLCGLTPNLKIANKPSRKRWQAGNLLFQSLFYKVAGAFFVRCQAAEAAKHRRFS
jgi:hypothetical protein